MYSIDSEGPIRALPTPHFCLSLTFIVPLTLHEHD